MVMISDGDSRGDRPSSGPGPPAKPAPPPKNDGTGQPAPPPKTDGPGQLVQPAPPPKNDGPGQLVQPAPPTKSSGPEQPAQPAPPPKSKYQRQENVPAHIFTPRTYQVEILDTALTRNTMVCLGTGTGKTFIAVMLVNELAHQIRLPYEEGGRRTIFLVNTVPLVEQQAKAIEIHTNLTVGHYVGEMGVDKWSKNAWGTEFRRNQVLVMTAQIFLDILLHGFVPLSKINLIVFDECHHATKSHPYAQIMKCFNTCPVEVEPRVLGLTASILNSKCSTPQELEDKMHSLEKTLRSVAETATDMVMSDVYGAKPKEIILECDKYADETGLVEQMNEVLVSALNFVMDSGVTFNPESEEDDPKKLPKTVLTECLTVLHQLGPWCTGKVATALRRQLDKIIEHVPMPETTRQFAQMASTKMSMVSAMMDFAYEHNVMCLEDFKKYMSPRVLRLMEILMDYKPNDNFMIIGNPVGPVIGNGMEGLDADSSDSDKEEEDLDSDVGDDNDSLDLSEEEEDLIEGIANRSTERPRGRKSQVHYVAVKRTEITNIKERDENALCGLIFVERRHTALALNKLIQELVNWEPDLFFVQSSHITGQGTNKGKGRETETMFKKQEDLLRRFRNRELNLLVATSVLEEGVDVPRCNLVVRFDLPGNFRSYIQSKGRARAATAKFYLLVDQGLTDQVKSDLVTFRGIEKILLEKCQHREDLTEKELDEHQMDELLPDYMPRKEDGAPRVTMTSAISLVNRYCAKLPSDAFTHLTPKCTTQKLGEGEEAVYVSTLQLPINSPVKQPIKGVSMKRKKWAKMAVALKACEILHKAGELDDHFLPVGKEMVKYEDEEGEWEEQEASGQARPGTTKRKQYYYKKIADALVGRPRANVPCFLYKINMALRCAITEEQNTRGRKIHKPEDTPRCFGILNEHELPIVPQFPVFTRSGEVTISVDLVRGDMVVAQEELDRLYRFHQTVFSRVLRLEKDPMAFQPEAAECSYTIVPLNVDGALVIDWAFITSVENAPPPVRRKVISKDKNKEAEAQEEVEPVKPFVFNKTTFDDAVVMPSYRNIDQPQYFYVAEIRLDLHPKSPFPSPELYDTFKHYYETKYSLVITNIEQPLLDVDHTSARLNLLTPRYMNQKGVALPTSSAETRRARRENLQQKQILVPELCDVHPFPASLWRKAVCLPAILYRTNCLLISEEIRVWISEEAQIGIVQPPTDHRFAQLEFGFNTQPSATKPSAPDDDDSSECEDTHTCRTCGKQRTSSQVQEDPQQLATTNSATADSATTNSTTINNGVTSQHSVFATSAASDTSVLCNGLPDVPTDSPNNLTTSLQIDTESVNEDEAMATAPSSQSSYCSAKETWDSPMGSPRKPPGGKAPGISPGKQATSLQHHLIKNLSKSADANNSDIINGAVTPDDENMQIKNLVNQEEKEANQAVIEESNALHGDTDEVNNVFNGDCDNSLSDMNEKGKDNVILHCADKTLDPTATISTDKIQNTTLNQGAESDDICTCADSPVPNGTNPEHQSALVTPKEEIIPEPNIKFDLDLDIDTFIGPSPCIILQTLTMSNANDFFNLERLETIGDSFLKLSITVYLYCTYPGIHEGKLSYLRSKQVSNYNLYRLGKKKGFPDRMVAAKFEPQENWLPPGYIIKKNNAYQGLNVIIASVKNRRRFRKLSHSERAAVAGEEAGKPDDVTGVEEAGKPADDVNRIVNGGVTNGKNEEKEGNLEEKEEVVEDTSSSGKSSRESTPASSDTSRKGSLTEMSKFERELMEATKQEEAMRNELPDEGSEKTLIPYNLQTQHSLPDKSIADCVEALIGCYLTTCGQRAALLFMTWLGLKAFPESQKIKRGLDSAQLDKKRKLPLLEAPPSPLLTHVVENAHSDLAHYLNGYEAFEEKIRYKFKDKSYLLQAFTHASYHYNRVTDCYQRLEFLGDAILDYVITRHLFEDKRKHSPGILTDLRSALVNNNIFAALAVKWEFHKFFKALSPQLFTVIDKFVAFQKDRGDEVDVNEEFEVDEEQDEDGEDVEIPKALGDIFESIAGAIYLDSGMSLDTVWRVYYRLMKPQIDAYTEKIPKSPVRELLELEPETAKFEKPERTYSGKIRVTVNVVGKGKYRGVGRNYRIAKSAAAKRALKAIRLIEQQMQAQREAMIPKFALFQNPEMLS